MTLLITIKESLGKILSHIFLNFKLTKCFFRFLKSTNNKKENFDHLIENVKTNDAFTFLQLESAVSNFPLMVIPEPNLDFSNQTCTRSQVITPGEITWEETKILSRESCRDQEGMPELICTSKKAFTTCNYYF